MKKCHFFHKGLGGWWPSAYAGSGLSPLLKPSVPTHGLGPSPSQTSTFYPRWKSFISGNNSPEVTKTKNVPLSIGLVRGFCPELNC